MKKAIPITNAVPPQFDYGHLKSPAYDKNLGIRKNHVERCMICGKPCLDAKYFAWEHCGGGTLVTREEGERLNKSGKAGGDLGYQPIGPECLKKHPELKAYLE